MAQPTLKSCQDNIEKSLGREMTPKERSSVRARVGDLLKEIGKTDGSPGAIGRVLQDFEDNAQARKAFNERARAISYRAYSELRARMEFANLKHKDMGEVMTSVFKNSFRNIPGAQNNLANLVEKEGWSRFQAFHADLMRNNVYDLAMKGQLDDKINMAIWDIRRGITPDAAKYGRPAVTIAQILNKHVESMREDMNANGAWIPKNDDRTAARTHDHNRIASAGGNAWGSDKSMQFWTDFVNRRMDWSKAFNGDLAKAGQVEQNARLESLWKQFRDDTHLKISNSLYGPGKTFGLNAHRELVFKSPVEDLEYFKKFGRGQSLAESATYDLQKNGKQLAMMKTLGVRAEQTLRQVFTDLHTDLIMKGNTKEARSLEDAFNKEMKNTWRLLTDTAGHPNDNMAGRIASSIRMTVNTVATGLSTLRLNGDFALKAGAQWEADRGNYFGNLLKSAVRQFTPKGLTEAEKLHFFHQMGARMEFAAKPLNDIQVDHLEFGAVARFNNLVHRGQFHSTYDNSSRLGSYAADTQYYHNLRTKSVPEMSRGERMTLSRFGINHLEWEIMRQATPEMIQGTFSGLGITPDGIRAMDLDKFKPMTEGVNPSEITLKRMRDRLADNYRNLLGENANRSVAAPSTSRNALLHMGTDIYDPNSIHGWVAHQALALKGWAINYMTEHLGRAVFSQYDEHVTLGKAMMDMMTGKNNHGLQAVGQYLAGSIAMAYVSNALYSLAKGQMPVNPVGHKAGKPINEQPWFDAGMNAIARGSLGLYSDFLFSGNNNPEETTEARIGKMALGPEGEFYANAADLLGKSVRDAAKSGGYETEALRRDEQRAFGFAAHSIPGTNLFWTKWAVDYYAINALSEAINPGYQKRLKAAAKKQNTYYLAGSPGVK